MSFLIHIHDEDYNTVHKYFILDNFVQLREKYVEILNTYKDYIDYSIYQDMDEQFLVDEENDIEMDENYMKEFAERKFLELLDIKENDIENTIYILIEGYNYIKNYRWLCKAVIIDINFYKFLAIRENI